MASAGFYFIVKGEDGRERRVSYRDFYGPMDKGSAKPSFCYPQHKQDMIEDIQKMEKVLENDYIASERRMEVKIRLRERKERLKSINEQEKTAEKLFNEHKDKWIERRKKLAEEISKTMPSRDAVKKKIVNPFSVLKKEKSGLEEKKREYIILSRLAGEESNVSFLQRDKDSDSSPSI